MAVTARPLRLLMSRPSFCSAPGFEIGAQLDGIHVVGALVDIDELGERSRLRDGFGSRDEGMGNGYRHVARLTLRRRSARNGEHPSRC